MKFSKQSEIRKIIKRKLAHWSGIPISKILDSEVEKEVNEIVKLFEKR